MWPINSCYLILDSVCLVDNMMFKRQVGSDKDKHGICLVRNRIVKDDVCHLRNEQLNPHIFCELFQKWGAVIFFIHDVYVGWNVPYINYSPKWYYGRLWDFIWWYAPYKQHLRFVMYTRFILFRRKENVLFYDTLNTFYLRLCDVRDMVKDHWDRERKP